MTPGSFIAIFKSVFTNAASTLLWSVLCVFTSQFSSVLDAGSVSSPTPLANVASNSTLPRPDSAKVGK